ncbi:MAG: 50S ribosomal protein L10 [Candidatus Aenigmatarchaeota archaeon]
MKKEEKIKIAEEIGNEIKKYKTLVVFDLFKIPTKEFKEIRKSLENFGKTIVLKKNIFYFSLKNAGIDPKPFENLGLKQIGIFLTNEDPFSIYKKICEIKTERFAKEGDEAESDIWVYSGPTQIKAGPSISEFARLKIPAGVEGGFIAVKKDTQVAKKGDKISKELASLLRKLKIKPISVMLNVICAYYKNAIYDKSTLNLVFEYPKLLTQAYQNAINLTINIGYPTKENINILISNAYLKAKVLENLVIKNE